MSTKIFLLICLLAPAEEAVKYVPRRFLAAFGKETSPYQGWPTDEQDQMWEDMYICK